MRKLSFGSAESPPLRRVAWPPSSRPSRAKLRVASANRHYEMEAHAGSLRQVGARRGDESRPEPSGRDCRAPVEGRVLGPGLLVGGKVGIGVLPERQELLVGAAGAGGVSGHHARPREVQL